MNIRVRLITLIFLFVGITLYGEARVVVAISSMKGKVKIRAVHIIGRAALIRMNSMFHLFLFHTVLIIENQNSMYNRNLNGQPLVRDAW